MIKVGKDAIKRDIEKLKNLRENIKNKFCKGLIQELISDLSRKIKERKKCVF